MEDRDERPETHIVDPAEPGAARAVDDDTIGESHVTRRASEAAYHRPLHARARIEGVEAGVAAGLVPPAPPEEEDAARAQAPRSDDSWVRTAVDDEDDDVFADFDGPGPLEPPVSTLSASPVLPDWRDPPTREVPRILLDGPFADPTPSYPGPVWREVEADWDDDDVTFAEIVHEGTAVHDHGLGIDEPDPFGFDFTVERAASTGPAVEVEPEGAGEDPSGSSAEVRVAEPRTSVPDEERGDDEQAARSSAAVSRRPGRGSHRARVTFAGRGRHDKATASLTVAPPAGIPRFPRHAPAAPTAPVASTAKRNPVVATVTGLAVGIAVLLIFLAGPVAVLALVTIVLVIAVAECFQVLRRARFRPAVLVGLLGVAAVAIAGYEKGPQGDLIVGAGVVIATLCWYLFGVTRRAPTANFAATVMAWAWIGLMGGFGTLLIAPRAFPHRHGLAYLLGAIVATVAYDVGGYAFGSWIGTRRLAPSISPNKTVEGLLGGCFAAVALSVAIVGHMHPWTVPHAFELGLVVAVFAPLGDLAESMLKRDIGVKDMGSILPAHGGLLDRVDALLFVLPATYCLVRLFHG